MTLGQFGRRASVDSLPFPSVSHLEKISEAIFSTFFASSPDARKAPIACFSSALSRPSWFESNRMSALATAFLFAARAVAKACPSGERAKANAASSAVSNLPRHTVFPSRSTLAKNCLLLSGEPVRPTFWNSVALRTPGRGLGECTPGLFPPGRSRLRSSSMPSSEGRCAV